MKTPQNFSKTLRKALSVLTLVSIIMSSATPALAVQSVFTDDVNMSVKKIVNLASPALAGDATNKQYVDDLINGLSWQNPVAAFANLGTCAVADEADAKYVKDEDAIYVCNGTAWVLMSSTAGVPNASTTLAGKIKLAGVLDGTYDSPQIKDGTLVNADISASAGIAGTKVSPNFGSQAISTTGNITGGQDFKVDYPTTGVYDDASSNSPYSRVNADSLHTNGLGQGQIYLEGSEIDSNQSINIGSGVAGAQVAQDVVLGNNSELFVDTSANRVGIGTTTPAYKLDVAGGINGTSLCISGTCQTSWAGIVASGGGGLWDSATGGVNYAGGNVGIGTTTPTAGLAVVAPSTANLEKLQKWQYNSADSYNLTLKQTVTSGVVRWTFDQKNNGTEYPNVMTFDRGNVGIGTTTPTADLTVRNVIKVGESQATTYDNLLPAQGGILFKSSGSQIRSSAIYQDDGSAAGAGGLMIKSTHYDTVIESGTVSTANILLNPTSGGNVGIGLTAPTQKLHVAGNSLVTGNTYIGATDSYFYRDTANRIATPDSFYVQSTSPATYLYSTATYLGAGSGDTTLLRGNNLTWNQGIIQGNGNVGIGTTTPTSKLTIYDTSNSVAGQQIRIGSSSSYDYTFGRSPTSGYLNFVGTNIAGNQYIGYTFNGKIGIGTTTPSEKLDVVGNAEVNGTYGNVLIGNSSYGTLEIRGNSTRGSYLTFHEPGAKTFHVGLDDAGNIFKIREDGVSGTSFFQINGATDTASFPTGNVGIGTTTPAYKLDVAGGINGTSLCMSGTCQTSWAGIVASGGGGLWDSVTGGVNYASGNVGIGTTAPSAKLHVSGNAKITGGLALSAPTTTDSGGVKTFNNVAQYYNGNVSIGTIVVTIGSTPNMMIDAEIIVQGYGGLRTFQVRGYTYTGTANWHMPAATCVASGAGSCSVRFGKVTASGDRVIMLGTTGTSWGDYPHVSVTRVSRGYSGGDIGNWSIGMVTSESAYTILSPVNINNGFTAYSSNFSGSTIFPSGTWNSSGNVGIGTTAPSDRLTVASGNQRLSDGYGLRWGDASVGIYGSGVNDTFTLYTNAAERLRVDSTGNVGIGTAAPTQKLDVAGGNINIGLPNTVSWILKPDTSSGTGRLSMQAGLGSGSYGGGMHLYGAANATNLGGVTVGLSSGGGGRFAVNNQGTGGGTDLFTVLQSGNVGIGITAPTSKLDVAGYVTAGGALTTTMGGDSGGAYLQFGWSGVSDLGNISAFQNLFQINSSNGPMSFRQENVEKMRIATNGNVGIGTTAPTQKLQVAGNVLVGGDIMRTAFSNGYFVGGHNNIGVSSAKTNPIFTIGSSYKPTDTTLGNMYGIGYTYTNASFITGGTASWGLYVAADGDARSFIAASAGGSSYFNAGNVGIGTATPAQKLTIASGDIQIDNTTFANQDGIIYKGTTPFIHNFNYGNNGVVTTVGGNTFIGKNAGNLTMGSTATSTAHASYNTVIGENALVSNTTGYYNTANGYASLRYNTTGHYNTANGDNSLYTNTTGDYNTANGTNSLNHNTTGSFNSANGAYSLNFNSTGNFNTTSGYTSLNANNTGSNNVAIGNGAGRYIANATNNTTGDYNVFLGSGTKALADNDQNEIVIGYSATGAGSNSVVLGNSSIAKTVLRGNIGIGTAVPTASLEVACPSGFRNIKAAGNQLGCMQVTENAAATVRAANDYCFTTYGGKIPSPSELYIAFHNFVLIGETGNNEWVDSMGDNRDLWQIANGESTYNWAWGTSAYTYRCWIPR